LISCCYCSIYPFKKHALDAEISIPENIKSNWVSSLQEHFDSQLAKSAESFKNTLEIKRLEEEIAIENLLNNHFQRQLQEDKQKTDQKIANLSSELHLHDELKQEEIKAGPSSNIQIASPNNLPALPNNGDGAYVDAYTPTQYYTPTEYRPAAPVYPASQTYHPHTSNYTSNSNYSTGMYLPADLPKRNDGFLDMRYSVNKSYVAHNMTSIPTRKDGRPDMRYSVNKQLFGGGRKRR